MLSEFRDFIARGNVLDLAVAVIIGAAFATITASLTDDIIMPIVGAVFGGLDFAKHFTILGPVPAGFEGSLASYADLKKAGVAVLGWGQFVTVVINFLIVAAAVFLLVKSINAARRRFEREEAAAPAAGPTKDQQLLTEIRDLLARRA